jgi:hypothetical protein
MLELFTSELQCHIILLTLAPAELRLTLEVRTTVLRAGTCLAAHQSLEADRSAFDLADSVRSLQKDAEQNGTKRVSLNCAIIPLLRPAPQTAAVGLRESRLAWRRFPPWRKIAQFRLTRFFRKCVPPPSPAAPVEKSLSSG